MGCFQVKKMGKRKQKSKQDKEAKSLAKSLPFSLTTTALKSLSKILKVPGAHVGQHRENHLTVCHRHQHGQGNTGDFVFAPMLAINIWPLLASEGMHNATGATDLRPGPKERSKSEASRPGMGDKDGWAQQEQG